MSKPKAPIRTGSTALLGCCELHTEREKTKYNTCPICLWHIHKNTCKERDKLRSVVEWIAAQQNLFFAECTQADAEKRSSSLMAKLRRRVARDIEQQAMNSYERWIPVSEQSAPVSGSATRYHKVASLAAENLQLYERLRELDGQLEAKRKSHQMVSFVLKRVEQERDSLRDALQCLKDIIDGKRCDPENIAAIINGALKLESQKGTP